jgi:hypothetical protein
MKTLMNWVFTIMVLVILLLPVSNIVNMIYQNQRINTNVVAPLAQAATFQDANDMLPFFEKALAFLDGNNLDRGNTCLFFSTTPQCELGNFHRKLEQDVEILNEVKNEPIASFEVTNAMSRIHQSLYKQGENGEHIVTPDFSFAMRWGTDAIFVTKLIEWFCGFISVMGLLIVASWAETE